MVAGLSWCSGGVGAVGFSLLGYSFLLLFFSCCWVSSPLGLLLCVVRKEKRVRKVCEEDGLRLCCGKKEVGSLVFSLFFCRSPSCSCCVVMFIPLQLL